MLVTDILRVNKILHIERKEGVGFEDQTGN